MASHGAEGAAKVSTPPKPEKPLRLPMVRLDKGRKGQPLKVLTNHFEARFRNLDGYFHHYDVSITYEDGHPVEVKGIGRKVVDQLYKTYDSVLLQKYFAYDGEKSLYTVDSLPDKNFQFTVVLDDISSSVQRIAADQDPSDDGDRKRLRRPYQSKTYKVDIRLAAIIPMKAIANVLRGKQCDNSRQALTVLDIILRQHAAKKGCLLVRQSFFQHSPHNFINLGGGVVGCRGFHSSFRATQAGLFVNMDVSTTMIIRPGPVLDFLLENQNVRKLNEIDWVKAKRSLKNLRIKVSPSNREHKITGLSEFACNKQLFSLKQRNEDGEPQTIEITVYDYFVHHRHIELSQSAGMRCIDVGKPKRPVYIPLELCSLISLQRYTKALSTFQRSKLVEASRQKPQERMKLLSDTMRSSNYEADSMLRTCGVSISTDFTQVDARILPPPTLLVGNKQEFSPQRGRWNFNFKRLVKPAKIERWAIVNFSARCDVKRLCQDLIRCATQKGMLINEKMYFLEENSQDRHAPPIERVGNMYKRLLTTLPKPGPQFLLCLLPERKTSPLYGPWKKINLSDNGVVTQCISPPQRLTDQYLTNVLLKINAKCWGLNSKLTAESRYLIPHVSNKPTLILGMDVSHGSPGYSDVPSIAAVVGSRCWPSISRYSARVRAQSSKVEMIDSLFKNESDTVDKGIIQELVMSFYESCDETKPEHIIIFRDGVSESQFTQVLNIELGQIIEACKFMDEKWDPKFTVIIAQKKHHTKFFLLDSSENVPAGTVIDTKICHPRNNDFYMCSHAGSIGTTRPTHYHVLYDEIGFSSDEMQELVHSLSYVYQRSTTAVSVVAPIFYAHHAASQMSQFLKCEDLSQASGHGAVTCGGDIPVQQLPQLHKDVADSMFFC